MFVLIRWLSSHSTLVLYRIAKLKCHMNSTILPHPNLNLQLRHKPWVQRLFWILLTLAMVFYVLDLLVVFLPQFQKNPIQTIFNMSREDALAAWFASVQTLMTGFVLLVIYCVIRADHEPKKRARRWLVLALFFVYLAVDDGAGIHEKLGSSFDLLAQNPESAPIFRTIQLWNPSFSWHLFFTPIFVGMGFFMLLFLWRELAQKNLRLILLAALGCYSLAVGFDFIEGIASLHRTLGDVFLLEPKSFAHVLRATEELLELLGTTFFLTLFLKHLTQIVQRIEIEF